ncbi:efflux RND transporter periplasmic adaptor subunit [Novosphingobium sp. 9U]|uniref:efflux RND transporter periplasmic adaptor subunit n=1 Tax=Novosphingobium sp. 9U TaxID=2653158 RepID=UPI0012EFCA15|nr:efflux RND transporter periplasmic adaptor subunit [Novosphingobium sp. 9U]VWX54339.1 Hemolysin secretion protein D [Novosphingobium sp. 9U]
MRVGYKSLVGVLLLAVAACSKQAPPPPPPPEVTVATPLRREVIDWDDYTGRFEAPQDVEVRARIDGVVTGIHFRNGQDVGTGAPLITIDPRPYQAALQQARAQVARAQATLANARSVAARSGQLAQAQAVSREELETDVAARRTAEADLAAARAAVRNAELNLSFTTVRAPFAGRASDRRVSLGDTVQDGETVLTRIVSLDPLWFTFEGAEAFYLKNLRQDQRGERGSSRNTANPVDIQLADEDDYRWHGRMEFLDNAIDPNSGTIRARAVVANPTRFLTPGMFGRARLLGSGRYQALLVPDEAIVTDQNRRLVYVVNRENKIVPRPVELGAKVEGLRIVRAGLAPTERVVLDGLGKVRPDTVVKTRQGQIKPSPGTQPAPTSKLVEPVSGQATTD